MQKLDGQNRELKNLMLRLKKEEMLEEAKIIEEEAKQLLAHAWICLARYA